MDLSKTIAFDTETWRISPGNKAPRLVCGSVAWYDDKNKVIVGRLLEKDGTALAFRDLLSSDSTIVGANIVFDLLVMARHYASQGVDIMPEIFSALEQGRMWDIQIAEALDAVADGCLNQDPRTGGLLTNPETGRRGRYSLSTCVDLVLGRQDAKVNDSWRERYGELDGVPLDEWPNEARDYPIDDARNTLEVGFAQYGHLPRAGAHLMGEDGRCSRCNEKGTGGLCYHWRQGRNQHDLANQVYTHLAMHLAAAWGFAVDQKSVDIIEADALDGREEDEAPFVAAGLLRKNKDGSVTKDAGAIAERVALAYGADASIPCPVCSGKRKTISEKTGKPINCMKCNATGMDLSKAPGIPRTDTGRIGMGRDVLYESGDDVLMAFAGYQESGKVLQTYVPALRSARIAIEGGYRDVPWTLSPNVLLETGRTSYDGVIQLIPRASGKKNAKGEPVPSLRECLVARPGCVFSSEDYEAGELITHAQSCLWICGYSELAKALNTGIKVHNALGASILGLPYEDFQTRIKTDQDCKDARQSAKCFHPDTEVLTKRGWVVIGDLLPGEEVAAANPTPGAIKIEWQIPTQLTRRKSPGQLVHLHNEGMDLRVTEEHRMLGQRAGGEWFVLRPEDMNKARYWYNAGQCDSGALEVDERLLRLAVASQADGSFCHNKIRFGFVKQRKIERFRALLRDGEFEEKTVPAKTSTGVVTAFALSAELSTKIRELLDDDKQFTWEWLNLTPALRKLALEEAQFWDGTHGPRFAPGRYRFSSTQRRSIDVLQAMAAISNRKSRRTFEDRQSAHHNDIYVLSVGTKPRSRGESLDIQRIEYRGDVVCLSVPSSFVLVRDGGVPVIVGQCSNFGFPGGMGPVKMVHQQRMQGPDTPHPNGPNWIAHEGQRTRGYKGLRFCILMDKAERCGAIKVTEWKDRIIAPTCLHCIQCAQRLKTAWLAQWPENKHYFQFINDCIENGQLIMERTFELWPHLKGKVPLGRLKQCEIMQHVSGRIRGGVDYCSAANSFFQGLLADLAKSALRRISRECYDRTIRVPSMAHANSKTSAYGGMISPLYGSRPIVFAHDEIICEHPEAMGHDGATRISEIMCEEMAHFCPDLAAAAHAEPTLMRKWQKSATAVRDANGRLLPWEPS